jgi:hypothetical protein
MRTTHACMACLASVLAAAPFVLTHCSGGNSSQKLYDAGSASGSGGGFGTSGSGSGSGSGSSSGTSSGTSSGDDAGASSGGSGGSGSGASSSGVGSPDGGQAGEAGASSGGSTCQSPDGGAPCDPGMVGCGSMSCTTASTYCCSDLDGGGTCDPYNGGSCSSGVKYQCNEAADCTSGVCCELDQYGPHSSSCMPSCPAGNFQVCRSDTECGGGDAGGPKKCILQTCPTSAGGGAGGAGFPGGPGGGTPGGGGSSSGGTVATITIEACAYPTTGAMGAVTWGPLPACTAK